MSPKISSFKRLFLRYVLRRKYIRTGACLCCGACCEQIYVKHAKFVIKSKEHFEILQKKHRFYKDLIHTGEDETGLVFACKNLDLESRKCRVHRFRAKICRDYPREEIFMMGGGISDSCGFSFEPIVPFSDILKKVSKKASKQV